MTTVGLPPTVLYSMYWKLIIVWSVVDVSATLSSVDLPEAVDVSIQASMFSNLTGSRSHNKGYQWCLICWFLLYLFSKVQSRDGRLLLSQIVGMVTILAQYFYNFRVFTFCLCLFCPGFNRWIWNMYQKVIFKFMNLDKDTLTLYYGV